MIIRVVLWITYSEHKAAVELDNDELRAATDWREHDETARQQQNRDRSLLKTEYGGKYTALSIQKPIVVLITDL